MLYNFLCIFLVFMIYSILGFIVEIISCTITTKKPVYNRGFLIGPYLPIYGTGAFLITLTLSRYSSDPLALFIMSAVYCSVLEYFTSLIMEKIFHLRWWDYTQNKFNINGRVCLKNAVLFGLAGLVIVEIMDPIILDFVYEIPNLYLYIISGFLFIIFLIDLIITLRIMVGVKVNVGKLDNRDATEQIKLEVKNYLSKHNYLTIRLIESFPNMEKFNGVEFRKFSLALDNVKKEVNKLKKNKE